MQRQKQYDGLRFVFICIVFLCHLPRLDYLTGFGAIYYRYFKNPTLALDFFFMLSGFGLYYSLHDKNITYKLKESFLFAINKIKKIYPVYVFSLLISLPNYIFGHLWKRSVGFTLAKTTANILLCLPLVQSLFGFMSFSRAINAVCWYLSTLFISYIFSPLFINIINKIKTKKELYIKLIITYLTVIGLSYIAYKLETTIEIKQFSLLGYIVGPFKFDALWYEHPIIRSLYLLLGMYIAKIKLLKNKKLENIKANVIEIAISIMTVLLYLFRTDIKEILNIDEYTFRFFDIVYCMLFMYAFSFGNGCISRLLSTKIMSYLGSNAMYVFLFHYPVNLTINTLSRYGFIKLSIPQEIILDIIITILIICIYKLLAKRLKNRKLKNS